MLCRVDADISSAPYMSHLVKPGEVSYGTTCDIILLVGLTELKAQVGWIDFETVRLMRLSFPTNTCLFTSSNLHVYGDAGDREKVCSDVLWGSPP